MRAKTFAMSLALVAGAIMLFAKAPTYATPQAGQLVFGGLAVSTPRSGNLSDGLAAFAIGSTTTEAGSATSSSLVLVSDGRRNSNGSAPRKHILAPDGTVLDIILMRKHHSDASSDRHVTRPDRAQTQNLSPKRSGRRDKTLGKPRPQRIPEL